MPYEGAHLFNVGIRGTDGVVRRFSVQERTRTDARRHAVEDICVGKEEVVSISHNERECPCKAVRA